MTVSRSSVAAGFARGGIELRQGLGLIVNYVFFPTIAILVMFLLRDFTVSDSGPSLGMYAIPGIIAMNVLFTGLMGIASTLLTEREDGTLLRVRTLPHGTIGYLIGKITSQSALTVVTFAVVMSLAVVLFADFEPSVSSLLKLVWLLPLGIASMLPLGIALGALVRHPRQLSFLSLALMGMTAVSGVFYPLALQAPVLQIIGQGFPLYWLGLGLRSALLAPDTATIEIGGSWHEAETFLALSIWAVVATLLALFALRRVALRARGARPSRHHSRSRSKPPPSAGPTR